MASQTKVEFAVDMANKECAAQIRAQLTGNKRIKHVFVDLAKQTVVVELDSDMSSSAIVNLIEATGRQAVLIGYGAGQENLGAAVAMMYEGSPNSGVQGVIRLVQTTSETCIIDGTLDGLCSNAQHKLAVHNFGDISDGCNSCGEVFDSPTNTTGKAVGDLGTVFSNENGRSTFLMKNKQIKIWDIIGRSIVVQSKPPGMLEWIRKACGIIARSAGIMENTKKICSCDGVTIWDEKNVPIAGEGRQKSTKAQL